MPFTKTPTQSTEETKTIPFMYDWETRDITNTKDTDNINVVYEKVSNSDTGDTYYEVYKRDGLTTLALSPLPATEIYGTYDWVRNTQYIVVTATAVMVYNAITLALVGQTTGLIFSNGHIGFDEFLFDDGHSTILISDGTHFGGVDSVGVWTAVTDPDLPVPHKPYPVVLDGYVFIASNNQDIFNSALNDPTSWSAGNFISAESYPDTIQALGRSGQYIVSFGTDTIQFFYDAANPTGTPLAAQTTVISVGFRGGLVKYKDQEIFIGISANGAQGVYILEGLKVQEVPNYPSTRRIAEFSSNTNFFRAGILLIMNGHMVYTWVDYSSTSSQPFDTIYGYDLKEHIWTRLAYGATSTFQVRTSVFFQDDMSYRSVVTFFGSAQPMQFSRSIYQDNGVNYTVQFRTRNRDFGTYRKKFASRVMIHGDQTSSSSNAFLSWSDDDFQTYSTPRAIDMAGQYKQAFRCGSFRKRSFKITYSDNFPMRWESLELDYSQGSS